jgi:hypothetical protein
MTTHGILGGKKLGWQFDPNGAPLRPIFARARKKAYSCKNPDVQASGFFFFFSFKTQRSDCTLKSSFYFKV